ncbi:hypothetical protein EV122DRAFT_284488 [Schizophyllum commune]
MKRIAAGNSGIAGEGGGARCKRGKARSSAENARASTARATPPAAEGERLDLLRTAIQPFRTGERGWGLFNRRLARESAPGLPHPRARATNVDKAAAATAKARCLPSGKGVSIFPSSTALTPGDHLRNPGGLPASSPSRAVPAPPSVVAYEGSGVEFLSCTGPAATCNAGTVAGAAAPVVPHSKESYARATKRGTIADCSNKVQHDLEADDGVRYH